MPRTAVPHTQKQMERSLKAAMNADFPVAVVRFIPDGTTELVRGDATSVTLDPDDDGLPGWEDAES